MIKKEPSLMHNPDGLLVGSAAAIGGGAYRPGGGQRTTPTPVTSSTSVKDLIDSAIEDALTNSSQNDSSASGN